MKTKTVLLIIIWLFMAIIPVSALTNKEAYGQCVDSIVFVNARLQFFNGDKELKTLNTWWRASGWTMECLVGGSIKLPGMNKIKIGTAQHVVDVNAIIMNLLGNPYFIIACEQAGVDDFTKLSCRYLLTLNYKDGTVIELDKNSMTIMVCDTDYATIEFEGTFTRKPLVSGDSSKLSIGDVVYLISCPRGAAYTLTTGYVANLSHDYKTPAGYKYKFTDFLVADLNVAAGSSGGPLLNADGEVVGIVSVGYNTCWSVPGFVKINNALSSQMKPYSYSSRVR